MTHSEFYLNLEEMLKMSAGSAHGGVVLADIWNWDSLSVIEFISFVDDSFGITIPAHEINACRTMGDLAALCGDHVKD